MDKSWERHNSQTLQESHHTKVTANTNPASQSQTSHHKTYRHFSIPVYYAKKERRYSSYEGEVSPAPEDLVKRDFHADKPKQLWLTDVSEFAGPDGKVYFSPIIDCFNGKVVAYRYQRD